MKKFFLNCLILFLIICQQGMAQEDTVRHRVFLVGDAGELDGGTNKVIEWLKKNVNWDDEKNKVVFLGDNIYPLGLPSESKNGDYATAKNIIDYQMSVVKGKKSKAYFIMGNHDWKNGKIGGLQQATNQVDYINGQLQDNIIAQPSAGCPGPVVVYDDSLVALVLMDSQWFLHTHDKPGPGSTCDAKTEGDFGSVLGEVMQAHKNQLVILAMHHPIHTIGVHGGVTYKLRHHIFPLAEAVPGLYIPLPVIGSIYPLARGIFGNIQDVNHPLYRSMANMIDEVLHEHPNTIVASGHDHSLQLLTDVHKNDTITRMVQIVSGSGAKLTTLSDKVRHNKYKIYAELIRGFSVVEVTKSGKVHTKFYNTDSADYNAPSFTKEIFTIHKTETKAIVIDTTRALPDSITVVANDKLKGSGMKHLFLGRNYRKEWTQPVTVPVLDLGEEQGGLRPTKTGGGKQTRSLRLEEKDGKEWALRSIEKFPEAAIPADLRKTVVKDIVEQGVSAAYPYGSLSLQPMAKAAGIPIIRRKLVWVPADPRLGRFLDEFDSTLAVLEELEPENVKKTDNTDELILKLAKDNDDHVDQKAVLKARLLDNFLMDFDRHEDQWRWATRDTGKGKIYYPIPRDHDQMFFVNQGIIPYFVRKPWLVPEVQGFRASADNIETFNKPARNFDRFFLTELDEDVWRNHIDTFLTAMTDEVIERSLHLQPTEVQPYSMNRVINTLKNKKKYFRDNMMDYYRFISKKINVVGTNDRELFSVTKEEGGNVSVVVNKIDKTGVISSKIYDRVFKPDVTQVIHLYALGAEDKFVISGGESPIKIRIIGGPGNDEFINEGSGGKVLLYDASYEENKISGNPGLKNKFTPDAQGNRYDRLGYKYDIVKPSLSIAYNVDDGVYLGAQIEIIKQGFRKEPYRMRQYLMASRALSTSSFRINYEGDYIKVIGNNDLLLRADIRAPINVQNFFGLGNDTKFDESKPGKEKFYRARYDLANASVLLRRQLQSWMRINYGPTFQYFRVEKESNQGKFISQPSIGVDQANLYDAKAFAGLLFKLDIDSKDNDAIPARGFKMDLNLRPLLGLSKTTNNLAQADIDMRVFISLFSLRRFVLASRLGYGRIFGDFEVPQAYYLGGTDNLRGYRRDRFAGRTMLYNNTELRFKVADFRTYLFPGTFGLLVFNDVGRVWVDDENSSDWHVGNGAGIWLAPIQRFVITASFTRSKEEKVLPLVTFGFQF